MTEPLRARLRFGLTDAMRRRDQPAVAVIRVALAAIDNAEAVPPTAVAPPTAGVPPSEGPIAGSAGGLGAGEAGRRDLDESDVEAIVASEIEQLLDGAAEYEDIGRGDAATELRQQAAVLDAFLAQPPA